MDFIEYLEINFSVKRVSGGNQVKVGGECPFCHEERPDLRLYVGVETGLGQCFHCGQGFNGTMFVAARERVSFLKAAAILAGGEDTFEKSAGAPRSERSMKFPVVVSVFDHEPAHDYLRNRGIGDDIIKAFKIGYAPNNTVIEEKTYYTAGRAIIPIADLTGKIVSWQGRDTTGKSKMRYLFPPLFKGSQYIYNAETIPACPPYLIMTEGVFHVYGWWRAGIKNAIGTFGKKVSVDQVNIMRAINPDVLFVAWDSDANTKKYEFIEQYGHAFKSVKIVDLKGKDSDELDRAALLSALSVASTYSWASKVLSAL